MERGQGEMIVVNVLLAILTMHGVPLLVWTDADARIEGPCALAESKVSGLQPALRLSYVIACLQTGAYWHN